MDFDSMSDRKLAYEMVVELLAHQFAFPVKWTDTQDVLLGTEKVQRLVEVGPSNTLTVMAKRTLDSKYKDHDTALCIKRQFLCCKSDIQDIYYEMSSGGQSIKETSNETGSYAALEKFEQSTPAQGADQGPVSHADQTESPPRTAGNIIVIPDNPVSVRQILGTLIAKKLKKQTRDVSWSGTIKGLTGGRSTLENEIVGDLISEFGYMPDRAEERRLDELAEDIQPAFPGKLGKESLSLINKMFTSKMPAGFGISKCREHLETSWALPNGHQDGLLLKAVLAAPDARLANTDDAKRFIDGLVNDYATENSIQLSSTTVINAILVPQPSPIDHRVLERLEEKQTSISKKLLKVYSDSIGAPAESNTTPDGNMKSLVEKLQRELDQWTAEHGEVYALGTQPMMNKKKVRLYDSAWNWVLVDFLSTYYDLLVSFVVLGDAKLESVIESLTNRSSPKLLEVIQYFHKRCQELGKSYAAAKKFLDRLHTRCQKASTAKPVFCTEMKSVAPRTAIRLDGSICLEDAAREGTAHLKDYVNEMAGAWKGTLDDGDRPVIYLKSKTNAGWSFDSRTTSFYLQELKLSVTEGRTFQDKTFLLIGAGPGSIGSEILRGLMRGGAQVIVTTSSYSFQVIQFFQKIYAQHGSQSAKLVLVPFNQGSVQDVESLVAWIYDAKDGLGWDLDFALPFAAIGEEGRDIDGLDSKSELAHRVMLTNTIRLLGAIKRLKEEHGSHFRPAQVVLPLSPNHGLFGNDGLYTESKLALEGLFSKWHSEDWGDYLSICGAVIGWTRGTGIMGANNIVAEGIEHAGVRTFSQEEMAFNILCLMTPRLVELCQEHPIYADLSGRFDAVDNFKETVTNLRKAISHQSAITKAIHDEDENEAASSQGHQSKRSVSKGQSKRLVPGLDLPEIASFADEVGHLGDDLRGMVDLDRTVVITGFAELGPYGNSRTRWQIESSRHFTAEGYVEMAWIMGLIKHHNGPLKTTKTPYCGWVDTRTGDPVPDIEVKARYEGYILEHTGIRRVEPALWAGYDPHKKQVLQEVTINEDLPAFEASKESALNFQREHGDKVVLHELENGQCHVRVKKGAVLMIPAALDFDNDVAGQIPTGWDPRTYGIPDDIISQVDPITLYALVCTVEAFLSAGITDPYEVYRHVHLAEVGNCLGTGVGGATSLNGMHKGRYKDQAVQSDVLQETYANTVTAWVNMLLLSSSGPIRTPVGACATSLESLDTAHDLIVNGKARMCLVGGVDDLEEDMAFEFANMKATVNAKDEYAKGRTPKDMSRPAASSRKGFVESQGCGVQVVMSARLALEMGVPIYGIIAFTGTASDGLGRSIPAPGKGVLSHVREMHTSFSSPMLDINFRRKALKRRHQRIEASRLAEFKELETNANDLAQYHQDLGLPFDRETFITERTQNINKETDRERRDASNSLGNHFWRDDPRISPIRGALAVWGLTADDITVASFHGTSTVLNEKNEFEILQNQMTQLGRSKGNRILGVFQKHLTGHPKGAAGAWMLNGCLQMARSGVIPGNSNADNVDAALEKFDYIVVPNRTIRTDGVKAFSVTSFGFGQKGTQAIGVHPRYLFATLSPEAYECYRTKLQARKHVAEQFFEDGMASNALITLKNEPPFAKGEEQSRAVLDPTARLTRQN